MIMNRSILSTAALLAGLTASLSFRTSQNGGTQLYSRFVSIAPCSVGYIQCFTSSIKGSGDGCNPTHLYYTQAGCPKSSRWLGPMTSND